jgi:hypothetical protein
MSSVAAKEKVVDLSVDVNRALADASIADTSGLWRRQAGNSARRSARRKVR